MKVCFQYSNIKSIPQNFAKGDFINETGIIESVGKFADVYYSGKPYDVQKKRKYFDYPEEIIKSLINCDADIYWIRANSEAARELKRRNKIVLYYASPYNEEIFNIVDIVFTQSKSWEKLLLSGNINSGLNPNGKCFKNVKYIPQTYKSFFNVDVRNNAKTKRIRDSYDADYIIGFFGRLLPWSYPTAIISLLEKLNKDIGKTVFIIGANNQNKKSEPPKSEYIFERNFTHENMPHAYAACDLVVESFRTESWNYAGSIKTLESCAVGTPILLAHSPARYEMLGEDYPLFVSKESLGVENSKEVEEALFKILKDKNFWNDTSSYCATKIQEFSQKNLSVELEKIFNELMNGK